jgi:phage gp36-like protein
MEIKLVETVLTGAVALAIPSVSYFLTKRNELKVAKRNLKLSQYQEFMDALSDILDREATDEGHQRFGRATNTLQLVASNEVIVALHTYREETGSLNKNRNEEKIEQVFSRLVWEIRKDLNDIPTPNPSDFLVRLYPTAPPKPK